MPQRLQNAKPCRTEAAQWPSRPEPGACDGLCIQCVLDRSSLCLLQARAARITALLEEFQPRRAMHSSCRLYCRGTFTPSKIFMLTPAAYPECQQRRIQIKKSLTPKKNAFQSTRFRLYIQKLGSPHPCWRKLLPSLDCGSYVSSGSGETQKGPRRTRVPVSAATNANYQNCDLPAPVSEGLSCVRKSTHQLSSLSLNNRARKDSGLVCFPVLLLIIKL